MEKIKKVQTEAKEKARLMAQENANLTSRLILYQRREMSSGPLAATELSLQEALEREAHLKKLEVQLKKEIARLKDELFKVYYFSPLSSQTPLIFWISSWSDAIVS